MGKMHKYSKIEDEFLIKNVKGTTLKELTRRFNEEFNLEVKESSISNRKLRLGLKSGIVGGQFEKGHIPSNKGKKWDEYMPKESQEKSRKTTFKKGDIPPNCRPIGSERIDNRDGGILVKVQEGHLQKNWMPKSRYIYEQAYGKIPKGHKVIFADGNNRNFELDNLVLVSNSEELIMNRNKLFSKNAEFTKIGVGIANVLDKVNKRGRNIND